MKEERRQCTATAKTTGKRCERAPAPGCDVCRLHGGAAPQVREAGRRRLALVETERRVATMGLPIDVDPHVALLQEVHRAAGVVAWLAAEVRRIDPDHVGFGLTKETVTEGGDGGERKVERAAATHVLVKMWGEERDRLVRGAKAAIDCGVSERLVRLQEAEGELVAKMLMRIFDDAELGLTEDQRQAARTVAARELRALPEAG